MKEKSSSLLMAWAEGRLSDWKSRTPEELLGAENALRRFRAAGTCWVKSGGTHADNQ